MSEEPAPCEFDGGDAALAVAEAAGPVCEKCSAELPAESMSACPSCGWYSLLGVYVEVEPQWEAAACGEENQAPPSHLQVWASLIPAWGWVVLGTTLAVAVASLGVRLLVAEDAALRATWAVLQLLGGACAAMVCHLLAFFLIASRDTDLGVADLVVNPLRAWIRLIREMPSRLWVLNSANASLSAALFAALIIGGIPYEKVWDWGFRQPVKKNLLGAIAEKANAGGGDDMEMDEAMKSFAQDAAVSGAGSGAPDPNESKPPAELQRKEIDALVVGYQASENGRIDHLLLATEHRGRLFYAGRVTPELEPEEAAEFFAKLRQSHAPRPFITVPATATWVQPRFTCRITYDKRVESGMLQGMLWEALMGEVKTPW